MKVKNGKDSLGHYHSIQRQRAHTIVAKFMKHPHQRKKLNHALSRLRRGASTTGTTRDWKKMQYPLADKGFGEFRKPE